MSISESVASADVAGFKFLSATNYENDSSSLSQKYM